MQGVVEADVVCCDLCKEPDRDKKFLDKMHALESKLLLKHWKPMPKCGKCEAREPLHTSTLLKELPSDEAWRYLSAAGHSQAFMYETLAKKSGGSRTLELVAQVLRSQYWAHIEPCRSNRKLLEQVKLVFETFLHDDTVIGCERIVFETKEGDVNLSCESVLLAG